MTRETFPNHGVMDRPAVPVVCIAGQGYGVWWPVNPYDWNAAPGKNEEIINWIVGVVNTFYSAVGRSPSNFGAYLA